MDHAKAWKVCPFCNKSDTIYSARRTCVAIKQIAPKSLVMVRALFAAEWIGSANPGIEIESRLR
jgi:hypothetical protein